MTNDNGYNFRAFGDAANKMICDQTMAQVLATYEPGTIDDLAGETVFKHFKEQKENT